MKPWLICILGLLLCGRTALGQSAPSAVQTEIARAKARSIAQEGARQYDEGNYTVALTKFLDAYATFATPRLFFNLGQTYKQLGRDVDATEAFEHFLAEAIDAPADTRSEARASITELRARVARVEVSSDVAGAEILIDGRSLGVAPLARAILVATGPHQVVVQKAGHETFLRRIDAQGNTTVKVAAHLAPKPSPDSAPPPVGLTPPPAADEDAAFSPIPGVKQEAAGPSWIPASTMGKAGLVLMAAAPVLVGTGLYFGSLAQDDAAAIKTKCAAGCAGAAIVDQDSDRTRHGLMQWIFLGTGVAALAAGAALYFLDGGGGEKATGEPRVSIGLAGGAPVATVTGGW